MSDPSEGWVKRREPLHRLVAAELRRRIQSGAWEVDALIPSEEALAAELGVGRSTIRESLRGLEQEGLIIRRQGVGSFVSAHANRIMGNLSALESFLDTIAQAGHAARMQTVYLGLDAVTDAIRLGLGMDQGDRAWLVKNLYYADNAKAILTEAYLPQTVLPADSGAVSHIRDLPLRRFLGEHCGVTVIGGVLTVEAVGATDGTAKILGVPRNHPLLKLSGNALDSSERPVYFMRSYINTSVYKFSVLRR